MLNTIVYKLGMLTKDNKYTTLLPQMETDLPIKEGQLGSENNTKPMTYSKVCALFAATLIQTQGLDLADTTDLQSPVLGKQLTYLH